METVCLEERLGNKGFWSTS